MVPALVDARPTRRTLFAFDANCHQWALATSSLGRNIAGRERSENIETKSWGNAEGTVSPFTRAGLMARPWKSSTSTGWIAGSFLNKSRTWHPQSADSERRCSHSFHEGASFCSRRRPGSE
jgi:hypothetical protein